MLDAIVIAGGVPAPDDPLYAYTQGAPKALVDVAGKPMIQWVLDALCGAKTVNNVVIIGLPSDTNISCDKSKAFIPSRGGMLDNIRGGVEKVLELNPNAAHALVVSADIPAITPEIVDWVINTSMQSDEDAYYNVVSRQVMEARYPGSRRSYLRLKDVEVCGGDMNVVRTATVMREEGLWEKIIAARKNAIKQAALLGIDTLILVLFRMVTLQGAIEKVTRRLNITGRALLSPYAELAMDVDKPHQLELLRADMQNRAQAPSGG